MSITKRDDESDMSMEEILASIRRYVAEDPSKDRSVTVQPPEISSPLPEIEEKVIYLTEDLEVKTEEKVDAVKEVEKIEESSLLDPGTVRASSQAFQKLADSLREAKISDLRTPPSGGVTIENFITELARPLIKQWIDQNLPKIVEKVVTQEITKITQKVQI